MDPLPLASPGLTPNRSRPRAQRLRLFQACVAGVILVILVLFLVNYPAGLTPLRFGLSITGLLILLGMNLVGINLLPRAKTNAQILKDWLFLISSALLIFGVIGLSGQFDLVYILSLVCIQADANQNIWPGGILFSTATLLGWFVLQVAFQVPITAIVGREFALVVGVVFGLVVVVLIQRTVRQTEQAEALLSELQAANRELGLARQKDKELAVAEERLRLARNLHDSVTQLLYSMSLYAGAAAEQLNSGSPETVAGHLSELQDTAQTALREMRLLVFELRPSALEQGGLVAALQARLDSVEARGGMKTDLQVEGEENLSPATQAELYNIAMEALNNVLKHAQAQSVRIRLEFGPDLTKLEIHDNGKGFEPEERLPGGFGITGMKERARKIGAQFQLQSSADSGTNVLIQVPIGTSGIAG
jgi:signal transduction histidine kinase